MQYICVQNDGLIQMDDLRLIGSSSKRGVAGKIGMFGSGWKYALAWLIRNDSVPLIFSGADQIIVDYNYKIHRDNPVRVITFDGEESSLTAEMGPTWQGWMAFREIFSNAIDEGGHTVKMDLEQSDVVGKDGVSRVFIPITREMDDVINNFNAYFSFKMKPFYTDDNGKLFIFSDDRKIHHFRKGIRCFENKYKESRIAIDFNEITIDEDRLAEDWDVSRATERFISNCTSSDAIKHLIKNTGASSHPSQLTVAMRKAFTEMNAEGIKFTTSELSRMLPFSGNDIIICGELLNRLVEEDIIDHPMSKWIKNGKGFMFVPDEIYSEMAETVRYYLSECIPVLTVQIGNMTDSVKIAKSNGVTEVYIDVELVKRYSRVLNEMDVYEDVDVVTVAKQLAAKVLIDMDDVDILAQLFN